MAISVDIRDSFDDLEGHLLLMQLHTAHADNIELQVGAGKIS